MIQEAWRPSGKQKMGGLCRQEMMELSITAKEQGNELAPWFPKYSNEESLAIKMGDTTCSTCAFWWDGMQNEECLGE